MCVRFCWFVLCISLVIYVLSLVCRSVIAGCRERRKQRLTLTADKKQGCARPCGFIQFNRNGRKPRRASRLIANWNRHKIRARPIQLVWHFFLFSKPSLVQIDRCISVQLCLSLLYFYCDWSISLLIGFFSLMYISFLHVSMYILTYKYVRGECHAFSPRLFNSRSM